MAWIAKVGTAVAIVLAAVACTASALRGDWDLFATLLALVVVQLALVVSWAVVRSPVTVRSDLGRWLAARATLTGEPVGRVLDRSVAAYRADLGGDRGTDDG